MLTYSETVNSTSATERSVRRISGQYLARAHLTRKQRAELAAALVEDSVEVSPPTVKQAAMLAAVPLVYVTKVRRNGKPKRNGSSSTSTETLAEHIARSSLAERIEAARVIGIDVIWDSMIEPTIAAKQTAAE
jgi:hypothetical protein